MGKALLSMHVLAAIIVVGPVTAAVNLFPSVLGVLGDAWVQSSIGLTLCAVGVMAVFVLPNQHLAIAAVRERRAAVGQSAQPSSEHSAARSVGGAVDAGHRPGWMGRLAVWRATVHS